LEYFKIITLNLLFHINAEFFTLRRVNQHLF